jgi:hypothetical protein
MLTTRLPTYGPASLLLLGLLSLLLWGQCGGTSGPSYEVRVARVDSLAAPFAGAPPRLHLTIGLQSQQGSDFKVESVHGVLLFRGLYWSDYNQRQNEELVVPGHANLLLPMVLTLTDSLACAPDSLHALQRSLRGGTAHDSTLVLQLGVNAYTAENSYLQDNGQDFPLPAMSAAPRRPTSQRQKAD